MTLSNSGSVFHNIHFLITDYDLKLSITIFSLFTHFTPTCLQFYFFFFGSFFLFLHSKFGTSNHHFGVIFNIKNSRFNSSFSRSPNLFVTISKGRKMFLVNLILYVWKRVDFGGVNSRLCTYVPFSQKVKMRWKRGGGSCFIDGIMKRIPWPRFKNLFVSLGYFYHSFSPSLPCSFSKSTCVSK